MAPSAPRNFKNYEFNKWKMFRLNKTSLRWGGKLCRVESCFRKLKSNKSKTGSSKINFFKNSDGHAFIRRLFDDSDV